MTWLLIGGSIFLIVVAGFAMCDWLAAHEMRQKHIDRMFWDKGGWRAKRR